MFKAASSQKIRQRFHGSAGRYDRHCGLHSEIAEKLLAQVIKRPSPASCLDVGCGTGHLTVKLKEHFPQSRVVGLDFAQGMLDEARPKHEGIAWVLGDIQDLPFEDGSFDMVVSNAAYQWAQDLPSAFVQTYRVLKPGGILMCTLFGHDTCQELLQSLQQAKAGLQFDRLPDKARIHQSLLAAGFSNPVIDSHEVKMSFTDMYELMAWIKAIGANNLLRQGFVGGQALARAASIYKEQFSYQQAVKATFEVIGLYAQK
ncbi:MAG: methyltransferase domain-containing protein [Candidatus Omnitrophica bacterium]|nr:methyltransferase domain-containing protein [Candidatus Omnitrophota bacterium]MDE2222165.1 methyltransferase domain-containing protein [Candidatus Omnitrophota bacterium]